MKQSISTLFFFFSLCVYSQFDSYYSSVEGKAGADIKTELHRIIAQDTINNLGYGAGKLRTWYGFYNTDRIEETNQVIDMYSSIVRYFPADYNYSGFGQELHIEHSFPKSWWGSHEWAAYKDLYHLYPSDGPTNSSKGNNPLGIVVGNPVRDNGVSKTGKSNIVGYDGNVFEPADEYKGDFARSYFYVVTAYENYSNYWNSPMTDNNTYPVWKQWAIDLLLDWNRNDPVSPKEQKRIGKVYAIQGNRNPFIDYPELAEYIWGDKMGQSWSFVDTGEQQVDDCPLTVYHRIAGAYIQILNCSNELKYEVYNALGRSVLSGYTTGKISTSGLSIGFHILVLKYNDKQMMFPIIISR